MAFVLFVAGVGYEPRKCNMFSTF